MRRSDTHQEEPKPTKRRRPESPQPGEKHPLPMQNLADVERRGLPIWNSHDEIVDVVRRNRTTIVVGETGSGKTTQLPQFLLDAKINKRKGNKQRRGKIAITQPRRVAAMSVAERVAHERGCEIGSEVGYCVRFNDKTTPSTMLKFLTDGMLLREAMVSRKRASSRNEAEMDKDDYRALLENFGDMLTAGTDCLNAYDVIILDEAHERTLQTDILFAVVKKLQQVRPTLKVIIMSATLNVQLFTEYFTLLDGNGAAVVPPVIHVRGRTFPVQVYYSDEAQEDYIDAIVMTLFQIHIEEEAGDVLVFLPGQSDIEDIQTVIMKRGQFIPPEMMQLIVCPMYAALSPEQQMEVFKPTPPNCRKIVLATNIAETSITITGIKYVVDSGLTKVRGHVANLGLDSLQTIPVAKAQSWQRAGRAGRQCPGKCFRLYTEDFFLTLEEAPTAEILRCSMSSTILQLKVLGISDPVNFDFIEKPTLSSLRHGFELLHSLGALSGDGSLSKDGFQMAKIPLEPQHAKLLLCAAKFECLEDILSMMSMVSAEGDGGSVFFVPKDKRKEADRSRRRFAAASGDLVTLLRVYQGWNSCKNHQSKVKWCHDHFINWRTMEKAGNIRRQLRQICVRMSLPLQSGANKDHHYTSLRRCLVTGMFHNVAFRQGTYTSKQLRALGKGMYKTVSGLEVSIHPSSIMHGGSPPNCVIYTELLLTKKKYIRGVTEIENAWLPELVPRFFKHV